MAFEGIGDETAALAEASLLKLAQGYEFQEETILRNGAVVTRRVVVPPSFPAIKLLLQIQKPEAFDKKTSGGNKVLHEGLRAALEDMREVEATESGARRRQAGRRSHGMQRCRTRAVMVSSLGRLASFAASETAP